MVEFRVLTASRELAKKIYQLHYPLSEKYNLESQLKRAVVSISLNLSEGNIFQGKNKHRFFMIARGSACEVNECLFLLRELYPQFKEEIDKMTLSEDLISVLKQLHTLTSNIQTP